MYDTGEDISPDDKVLILQTCSYKKEFDSSNWLYDYGYSYEYKDNVIIMNNYSGTHFGKEGENICGTNSL